MTCFLRNTAWNLLPRIHKRCLCLGTTRTSAVKLSFDKYDAKRENVQTSLPLIVFHGLFGSRQNWKTISKRLNADLKPYRTIYTVDVRNHGYSPRANTHSYEDMAEDLAELYRTLGISKAALMGHSMGGRSMIYFALKYPELVDKTIIVDISQYYKSSSVKETTTMLNTLRDLKLDNSLTLSNGRRAADEALKIVMPDKPTRDFILLNLTKNADEKFEWRINLDALKENLSENIFKFPQNILTKKFCGPTLFIGGTKSNYIDPKDVGKIKINFPRAEFEFIEQAGHLVHIDQPAKFIEVTTRFLNAK